jgi:hypothetical protein
MENHFMPRPHFSYILPVATLPDYEHHLCLVSASLNNYHQRFILEDSNSA